MSLLSFCYASHAGRHPAAISASRGIKPGLSRRHAYVHLSGPISAGVLYSSLMIYGRCLNGRVSSVPPYRLSCPHWHRDERLCRHRKPAAANPWHSAGCSFCPTRARRTEAGSDLAAKEECVPSGAGRIYFSGPARFVRPDHPNSGRSDLCAPLLQYMIRVGCRPRVGSAQRPDEHPSRGRIESP